MRTGNWMWQRVFLWINWLRASSNILPYLGLLFSNGGVTRLSQNGCWTNWSSWTSLDPQYAARERRTREPPTDSDLLAANCLSLDDHNWTQLTCEHTHQTSSRLRFTSPIVIPRLSSFQILRCLVGIPITKSDPSQEVEPRMFRTRSPIVGSSWV